MQHSAKQGNTTWTEKELGQYVGRLKVKKMHGELIEFLQARLADDDSVCKANRPRLYNELGLAMVQRDDISEAANCFEQALKIDPENRNALYNLANMHLHLNDFETALGHYMQVLRHAPDHVGSLYNSALCHALGGNKEAALPLFIKVTELKPEYAGAQFWAGECLLGCEQAREALPFFKKASTVNPGHFEAAVGLTITQYKTHRFEDALSTCDDLLHRFDPSLLVLRIKGDSLLAIDCIEEAALSHVEMAYLDFDCREFLLNRTKLLALEDTGKAKRYAHLIAEHFSDLEPFLAIQTDHHRPITGLSANITEAATEDVAAVSAI